MFSDLLYRLRALFRRKSMETEMDEELREHFERQIEKNMKAGLTREEAMRLARIKFGGHEQLREECRDARGVSLVETFVQDIRYGLRILGRTPVITSVAILSLALGIGANTAIFSLIDTVMLRMLPVQKPEELVQVLRLDPQRSGAATSSFTNPLWEQLRDHQDVFSSAFAWDPDKFDLGQGGAVHNVDGIYASGDYFSTLGVRPAAGRLLTSADDKRGCAPVVVLSYGFWQEHFGGAESAIGSTFTLSRHPFEVIGVSAPGFYGVGVGSKFDVAIPICAVDIFDAKDTHRLDRRSFWWLNIMGRAKPGISQDQLKARLAALSPEVFGGAVPQDYEVKDQQRFVKRLLVPVPGATGTSYLRQQFEEPLNILMGVVGLVLLIACANIASLMMARAAARHKEIAVRKALGASRTRLIRQLLTECVLLSTAGGLLGLIFARWGSAVLVRYISTRKNDVFLNFSLDWRILGFTAAAAIATGFLFGVLPAFRSTRVSLTSAMKGSQAMEAESQSRFRPGKWIVALQLALSLVLLVASGLFVRSLAKLVAVDLGFDRNNVLIVHSRIVGSGAAGLRNVGVPADQQEAMFQEIETRLSAVPGIVSVSRSIMTPITNFEWNNFLQVDAPNPPTGDAALAYFNFISPSYFATMRTPLLEGRNFSAADNETAPKVAMVNETLARRFFPGGQALGKYFKVAPDPGKTAPPIQVVGIVKDSKYESLREDTYATAYFPLTQIPEHVNNQAFELRTNTRPSALISAVQDAVGEINKEIPLEFNTLAQQVDDSLVQERLLAKLSTFFGSLALLLAMIGLYGALSYFVTQRQAEFGIRIAIGASRESILALVMRDVVLVLVGGVVAGTGISLLAVGLLQKLLFGLAARDTITLLVCIGILSAVALLAGYLPARRATRVDPVVALRYE